MSDQISQAIIRLYESERFYAELLLQMDRIINEKIPTACVCVKSRIELHINPKFFSSLSAEEQIAILKHECQHILNNHIERAKEIYPEIYDKDSTIEGSLINNAKHTLINFAADLSINPGITNIPKFAVKPALFNLEEGHTMEWYIENLKNNEKMRGLTHFDDHSLWSESDGRSEEIKTKVKQAINRAAKQARAAGKMSGENELLVNRINYKARDWKGDLKRFAARALEVALETSKKKRNRRYGIMYPGTIKEETLHVGVALDTSGSISDEALCQFMAEVANIAKHATVTVVEADSEVKNAYIFDPKKKYSVKGRGGTAYQPAFDYFTDETDVDGVIYFGDMDCSDERIIKPKYPVLWAIVGPQEPPAKWGSKTKVEVKRD